MAKILVVIGLVGLLLFSIDALRSSNYDRDIESDLLELYEEEVSRFWNFRKMRPLILITTLSQTTMMMRNLFQQMQMTWPKTLMNSLGFASPICANVTNVRRNAANHWVRIDTIINLRHAVRDAGISTESSEYFKKEPSWKMWQVTEEGNFLMA